MNYREGILLVNKPAGFTSHDIVDLIRKGFGFRKVGHAGTRDAGSDRRGDDGRCQRRHFERDDRGG